ncbi:MAG: ATP-dependent protease ATPase subunit HslU [Acidobacteriota bacterium]
MVFCLPEKMEEEMEIIGEDLTPKQIVAELDKYIVGQHRAKRAVAIALRNRIRRQKLSPEIADEVAPKNIIMIGPTGIGKTEIARRLARLMNSPFIKVEASKFTEVGYVGRDVESMVRDLTEIAVDLVRQEKAQEVRAKAERNMEERLLNLLLPPTRKGHTGFEGESHDEEDFNGREKLRQTREKLRQQLRDGLLEDRVVELDVRQNVFPAFRIFSSSGMEEMDVNIRELLPGFLGGKPRKKKMKVSEAREQLLKEEEDRLIDPDLVARIAVRRVEQAGIIFVDELDKIAGRESGHGPDVSREGVQRDILPIVEGTIVNTKYGMVRTDHILFIAAGAFHVSKPSDLIPELQGRFPIRVELDPLGKEEFIRILKEPKNALLKQYNALMKTEGIDLQFTEDAIEKIAEFAAMVNERSENIGARRLHTIMERLMDEISFEGRDLKEQVQIINGDYVKKMLSDIVKDQDLSRYVL